MGMDLSNHGSGGNNHSFQSYSNASGHNNLHPMSLSSGGSHIHHPIPVKRRKKETPRRIESLPRIAHSHPGIPLPLPLLPLYNSQLMQSENAMDDDDPGSDDDSVAGQDKNHIDIKSDHHDMNYDYSNDGDGPENYADHEQSRQSMDEDIESNGGHGDRADGESDHHDPGLAGSMGLSGLTDLRIGISNSIGNILSERDGERERSRKGNPIKKIHIGNNNNNNDTSGSPTIPSLIHNAAMD